ncbi:MAG: hypothetical protein GEU82_17770 [Luteitalea sp.]|nr:hypothetical protein [Luteitalea sp.]
MEGDALNGTVTFGDFGGFPFKGKRPKAAAAATPATPAQGGSTAATPGATGKWNLLLIIPGAGKFPLAAALRRTPPESSAAC